MINEEIKREFHRDLEYARANWRIFLDKYKPYLGDLLATKEIVLKAIDVQPELTQTAFISFCKAEFRDDEDIVLASVKKDSAIIPGALSFASERLRSDKKFVIEVLKLKSYFFSEISEELKKDKDIVLIALKSGNNLWGKLNQSQLDDKDIMLEAVKQYGLSLEHASNRLKIDQDIVLAAVNNMGESLKFAGLEFRTNENIVKLSLKQLKNELESKVFIDNYDKANWEEKIADLFDSIRFKGNPLINNLEVLNGFQELIDLVEQKSKPRF